MRTFRSRRSNFRTFWAAIVLALALPRTGRGQTFEIVHTFAYGRGEPYGIPLEIPDGRIFGTTQSGGDFEDGSIYVLTPDGLGDYEFGELHSFHGPDGSAPVGALFRAANGAMYGTTNSGGANGLGTIYRVDTNGAVTTLHHFGGADGQNPAGGVAAGPDGALYGLCNGGGAIGYGAFYRISLDGDFELLHSFGGPGSGLYPIGELLPADGGFYGVAYAGGTSSHGTVFRIELDGTVTPLHEFAGADGMNPVGGLVLDGGKLYGATAGGGDAASGTVFSVDPVSLDFDTVHSLVFAEGNQPLGRLLLADGKLYGTAHDGGANGLGSVFRVDPATGDTEAIHSFAIGEGAHPKAGLMQSASGDFFGTTFEGTTIGWGTVFRTDSNGATETVHIFYSRSGQFPQGLALSDGIFVGVTSSGGNGYGTAFRFVPDGPVESIHEFSPLDDGGWPSGSLLVDGGFVYGTTTIAFGTAFRIDSSGVFEKLVDFSDGSWPVGGLMRASDGNFYGSMMQGGTYNQGTLYAMDENFIAFPIHNFAGDEGGAPKGTLVEGTDGKLYGTTYTSPGTVFRADTEGNLEPLHTFDESTEGSQPDAGLVLAQDGYFYGTLSGGGAGWGSIFRMDGDGMVEVVHSFVPLTEGYTPRSALVEDAQGNLIGTASGGGPSGWGSVYRFDPNGGVTVIHGFGNFDGAAPTAEVVVTADGDIYGVTEQGGPGNFGTIFRILAAPPVAAVTSIFPSSGRAAGGTALKILGAHLPVSPGVSIGGHTAGDPIALSNSTILATSPALSPGTLNDVVVSVPALSNGGPAVLPGGWLADFLDVPAGHLFHDSIEAIFRAGVTAGCGTGIYCPSGLVTRAQMAVFLLKAEHGSNYLPPQCDGDFADVPCPGLFADWIEQLAAEGITAGCGVPNYCPDASVTRAQMAAFLLKTLEGSGYAPPPATGTVFDDVPAGAFAAAFIEELASRGITGGCSVAPPLFCPNSPNTRGQMAVFLDRTFDLP